MGTRRSTSSNKNLAQPRFQGRHQVLEILKRLPVSLPKNADVNCILTMMMYEWMVTIEEMRRDQPVKIAKLMDQLHETIMLER